MTLGPAAGPGTTTGAGAGAGAGAGTAGGSAAGAPVLFSGTMSTAGWVGVELVLPCRSRTSPAPTPIAPTSPAMMALFGNALDFCAGGALRSGPQAGP